MRVLALHIFSPGQAYERMLLEQRRMEMTLFPEVSRYFLQYRQNPNAQEVVVEGDMVYVHGAESGTLGITEKNIRAMAHLLPMEKFDYVVRSNISTVILWPKLLAHLRTLPRTEVYTGAVRLLFQEDPSLSYVQGTLMVWSEDVARSIVQQEGRISRSIVDDVTFGYFLRDYCPTAYASLAKLPEMPWRHIHVGESVQDVLPSLQGRVMVRLRVDTSDASRQVDIARMRQLVDHCNTDVIPPILFLYWTGCEPPPEVLANCESFRAMNPDVDVRFVTDQQEAELLRYLCAVQDGTLIPLAELFPRISIPSCKADVMRVVLLYLFGGMYVDCASAPAQPLTELHSLMDTVLAIPFAPDGDYSTRLLAARKMCDPLYRVLLKMQENLLQQEAAEKQPNRKSACYNILLLTGTYPFYHVLGRNNTHGLLGVCHITEHDYVIPYGVRLQHHTPEAFETSHWSNLQKRQPLFLEKNLP